MKTEGERYRGASEGSEWRICLRSTIASRVSGERAPSPPNPGFPFCHSRQFSLAWLSNRNPVICTRVLCHEVFVPLPLYTLIYIYIFVCYNLSNFGGKTLSYTMLNFLGFGLCVCWEMLRE